MEFAISILSASQILSPICPPKAFINVNAIPPQIINSSTLSIRLLRIIILLETFAPPTIAIFGPFLELRTLFTLSISLNITSPKAQQPLK